MRDRWPLTRLRGGRTREKPDRGAGVRFCLTLNFHFSASGLTIEFVEGSLDVEPIQLTFGVSFVCPLHPCCHFVPSPLNTDPPLDISNGSHQEVQGRQDLRVYQLQVAARCQEWKGGFRPRLDAGS